MSVCEITHNNRVYLNNQVSFRRQLHIEYQQIISFYIDKNLQAHSFHEFRTSSEGLD